MNIYSVMKEHLRSVDNGCVENIHDLHIWTLNGSSNCLSVHIMTAPTEEGGDTQVALNAARQLLREKFGISHATIQVEERGKIMRSDSCNSHKWHTKAK